MPKNLNMRFMSRYTTSFQSSNIENMTLRTWKFAAHWSKRAFETWCF
jgi:hypothetical protein